MMYILVDENNVIAAGGEGRRIDVESRALRKGLICCQVDDTFKKGTHTHYNINTKLPYTVQS